MARYPLRLTQCKGSPSGARGVCSLASDVAPQTARVTWRRPSKPAWTLRAPSRLSERLLLIRLLVDRPYWVFGLDFRHKLNKSATFGGIIQLLHKNCIGCLVYISLLHNMAVRVFHLEVPLMDWSGFHVEPAHTLCLRAGSRQVLGYHELCMACRALSCTPRTGCLVNYSSAS
jgi:hypothetical protein